MLYADVADFAFINDNDDDDDDIDDDIDDEDGRFCLCAKIEVEFDSTVDFCFFELFCNPAPLTFLRVISKHSSLTPWLNNAW